MQEARGVRIGLLLALLGAGAGAQEAVRVKVIINSSNSASIMRREDAALLFLNRTARWKGMEAAPVDQSLRSPLREVFSQEVIRQTPEWVQHYWQKRILNEREFPPPVKASDDDVIAFVEKNTGGIGYVAEATVLPATVKVLRIVE